MLQLLDKRCKATMINMLSTLMEIVDNVQKQRGRYFTQRWKLRTKRNMQKMKKQNNRRKMKNSFGGLINTVKM